jgi:hypothetical protein
MLAMLLLWRPLWGALDSPKMFQRGLLDQLSQPPPGPEYCFYVAYRALQKGWKKTELPLPPARPVRQDWKKPARIARYLLALRFSTEQ